MSIFAFINTWCRGFSAARSKGGTKDFSQGHRALGKWRNFAKQNSVSEPPQAGNGGIRTFTQNLQANFGVGVQLSPREST